MPGPHGRGNDRFAKPKDAKKTLLRLLGYLSRRKLPLVGVGLLLLVSVGTNLGGSYYMRPLINSLVDGTFHGPGDLLRALIPLGGVYLVGAGAAYLQSVTMARLAQKGANRLRGDLLSLIHI